MKNSHLKQFSLLLSLSSAITLTPAVAQDYESIAVVIPFESQKDFIEKVTGLEPIKPQKVTEIDGTGQQIERKYFHHIPTTYHISLGVIYPKNGSFSKQDIQFVINATEKSVKKYLTIDEGGLNKVQLFTPLKDLNSKEAIDRSTFNNKETAEDVFQKLKDKNGKTSITDGFINLQISTNGVLADVAKSLKEQLENNKNFKLPDYEFKSHITLDHITRSENRENKGLKSINFKSKESIARITDEFNEITNNVIKAKKNSQSGISLKINEVVVSGRDSKHKDHKISKMTQKNGTWGDMHS